MAVPVADYSFNTLAALQAFQLGDHATPGDTAYVLEDKSIYVITATDTGGFPVSDVGGLRWIKQNDGSTDGLMNGYSVFVSPEGNDSNNGSSWQVPMRTGYAAYQKLYETSNGSGGDMFIANGTAWGGPVTNQGIWLRSDGLLVSGFLPTQSVRFIGVGGGSYLNFGEPASAVVGGDPGDRKKPWIWVVGPSGASPLYFNGLVPAAQDHAIARGGIFGWDYRRNPVTNEIDWANVTEWDRNDGVATLTVSLPSPTTITGARRISGVVTVYFAAPVGAFNAYYNMHVQVTSSNPDFVSGDYVITDYDNVSHQWIQYLEAGPDVPLAGVTGMTWATHGILPYDRIEVISTNSQILSTSYRCYVTTATQLILVDSYGFSPRTANVNVTPTAGTVQYVLQDRANYAIGKLTLINVSAAVPGYNQADNGNPGPTMDFGGTTDGRIIYTNSACNGFLPVNQCTDLDREAWMLLDPGSHSASAITYRDHNPGYGGTRIYGSKNATWGIDAQHIHGDTPLDVLNPPSQLVIAEGGNFGRIYVRDVLTDDGPGDIPNVISDANPSTNVILDCGLVEAQGVIRRTGTWSGATESAIRLGQYGVWATNRINGDTPFARRIATPVTARFQNWIQNNSATWNGNSGQVTFGAIADPYGGTTAVRATRNSGSSGVFLYPADSNHDPDGNLITHAVGDGWIIGGMVRPATGSGFSGSVILSFNMNGANGGFALQAASSFAGDGEWQWFVAWGLLSVVDSINAGVRIILNALTPAIQDVSNLICVRVPAGTMSANEFTEYAQTLQGYDSYLLPGITGTQLKNQKFIGHGGLGTSLAYVEGVGSGQLTIVGSFSPKKYEPVFTQSGAIKGWVELVNATINA